MQSVIDTSIRKAYGDTKKIAWMEVYAGEKATKVYGDDIWLPEETVKALKDYTVSIKGPLATPIGGGIRSLNVSLRQHLDLYVCLKTNQLFYWRSQAQLKDLQMLIWLYLEKILKIYMLV